LVNSDAQEPPRVEQGFPSGERVTSQRLENVDLTRPDLQMVRHGGVV